MGSSTRALPAVSIVVPDDASSLLAAGAWAGIASFTWTLGRRLLRRTAPGAGGLDLYRAVVAAGARGGRVGAEERAVLDALAASLAIRPVDAATIEREILGPREG